MVMGYVVVWNCDPSQNVMGRVHTNFILDTRMYRVEIAENKVTS